MAIWAWRTFRISIFAWLVVGRLVGAAASLLTVTPDPAPLESAMESLQTQRGLTPSDIFLSTLNFATLFPILSTLGFALIALGELSHLGPRIARAYEQPKALAQVYRLRHLFGLFAVTCSFLPSTAVSVWFRSME